MEIKPGVRIQGVRPETLLSIMIADGVWKDLGQELVITTVIDGKHKSGSDHYWGGAWDARTRYFTEEEKKEAVKQLEDKLGRDFLVLWHATHIHISYRPRHYL